LKDTFEAESDESKHTVFDRFWTPTKDALHEKRATGEMFAEMRSSTAGELPWKSAKSLGKYMASRFSGDTVPRSEDDGHKKKLWAGFARASDE